MAIKFRGASFFSATPYVFTHKYMNAVGVDDADQYGADQTGPEAPVHVGVRHSHDAGTQTALDQMEQCSRRPECTPHTVDKLVNRP